MCWYLLCAPSTKHKRRLGHNKSSFQTIRDLWFCLVWCLQIKIVHSRTRLLNHKNTGTIISDSLTVNQLRFISLNCYNTFNEMRYHLKSTQISRNRNRFTSCAHHNIFGPLTSWLYLRRMVPRFPDQLQRYFPQWDGVMRTMFLCRLWWILRRCTNLFSCMITN